MSLSHPGSGDYVAIGFFTPAYEPLARRFLANLLDHDIPACLFPWPETGWKKAILQKPFVVKQAFAAFPNQTVVLCDIDLILRGSLEPLVRSITADVALHQRCKLAKRWRFGKGIVRRHSIWPSSRIMVIRPTDDAKILIENWARLCAAEEAGEQAFDDEILLARALSMTGWVSVQSLPWQYAAFEVDEIGADAIVAHKSEHDKVRHAKSFRSFKTAKRRFLHRAFGIQSDWQVLNDAMRNG